jgi:hypothetical protein
MKMKTKLKLKSKLKWVGWWCRWTRAKAHAINCTVQTSGVSGRRMEGLLLVSAANLSRSGRRCSDADTDGGLLCISFGLGGIGS